MDECHHATKKHPYSIIMQMYKRYWIEESRMNGENKPTKILGLTASVVSVKCALPKFFKLVDDLEKNLWYTIIIIIYSTKHVQFLISVVDKP